MVQVLDAPDNFFSSFAKAAPDAFENLSNRQHQSKENEKNRAHQEKLQNARLSKEVAEKLSAEDKAVKKEEALDKLDKANLENARKYYGNDVVDLLGTMKRGSASRAATETMALQSLTSQKTLDQVLAERRLANPNDPEVKAVEEHIRGLMGNESNEENQDFVQPNKPQPVTATVKPTKNEKTSPTDVPIEPQRYGETLKDYNKRITDSQVEERKNNNEFHKESKDFDAELLKNESAAKKQQLAISDIEKAVNSGNVKPSSWANLFKGFGTIGDKISQAVMNGDESTLQANIPYLLEGWKETFGVRLSDADLKLLEDKLPSIGKSQDANKSVIGVLKKYSNMTLQKGKVASEIVKENKGLRPLNYSRLVEERFSASITPVKVKSPVTGRTIEIPAYKLEDALKGGAKIVNE